MSHLVLLVAATTLFLAACGNAVSPTVVPPTSHTSMQLPALSDLYYVTPAPGEDLPTSQTTPGPIPLAYRHVWAINPKDCTADPGFTRIAIAPGAVRFYAGRAVVSSSDESRMTTLVLTVEHTSEGQTTPEIHTLALGGTGTKLSYSRRDSSFTYVRCD